MAKKLYPTDTLEQALSILAAWNHIDPLLKIGPLTSDALVAEISEVKLLQEKIRHLQTELLNIRNQRDAACIDIWSKVKRARAGIKVIFGDDSSEYELAGGTRASDRKSPRRRILQEMTPSALSGTFAKQTVSAPKSELES